MRRLFFPFSGTEFYLEGESFHHWVRVNRAQVGDEIEISDGTGKIVVAKLEAIEENRGLLQVVREIDLPPQSEVEIILGIGLLKGEKMDWLIQKSVEIGVTEIWPLELDQSIVKLDSKKSMERQKRWQKIALEAAQQCGGRLVPLVRSPQKLSVAVKTFGLNGIVWVPHERGNDRSFKQELQTQEKVMQNLIIIGPEGGFSDKETDFLSALSQSRLVTLGERILRAETAGLVALSLLRYEWDDLGGQE